MSGRHIEPTLPPAVVGMLEGALEGVSRQHLRAAADRLGETYSVGGHTDRVVRNSDDALAYAVSRMPSTYAAVRHVLASAADAAAMVPRRLIDLGAGPGTATLAAASTWRSIVRADLVERNPHLAELAGRLVGSIGIEAHHVPVDVRLRADPSGIDGPSDTLVVASYVLVEQSDADAQRIVENALSRPCGMLVLVEPGTKRGFDRILAARRSVAAAGWTIAAPCPHGRKCPLPEYDWCHFTVRLPRRRMQLDVKSARVPFEDEPFSYIVAVPGHAGSRAGRILSSPRVTKGEVCLSLCTEQGLVQDRVARRDKDRYRRAAKAAAGETWPQDSDSRSDRIER